MKNFDIGRANEYVAWPSRFLAMGDQDDNNDDDNNNKSLIGFYSINEKKEQKMLGHQNTDVDNSVSWIDVFEQIAPERLLMRIEYFGVEDYEEFCFQYVKFYTIKKTKIDETSFNKLTPAQVWNLLEL